MIKIVFVDYAHYTFIEKAVLGLTDNNVSVQYVYSSSFPSPSTLGREENGTDDAVFAIPVRGKFKKNAYVQRYIQEFFWAKDCVRLLADINPDIVVASNTPIGILSQLQKWCLGDNKRFVLWLQDIHSRAIQTVLKKKLGILGQIIGTYFKNKEQSIILNSDYVIAITFDHLSFLRDIGVSSESCSVLPNWADFEGLPDRPKVNSWSLHHGFQCTFNFLYSGTLGLKHNPDLLLALAKGFDLKFAGIARVIVVSEGEGADWLKNEILKNKVKSITVLGFQGLEDLPDVLATADVLTAILESEAGTYSVPSKILSYLCAERPILAAMPMSNLASEIIKGSDSGVVVEPSDIEGYIQHAYSLIECSEERRLKMGANARAYAQDNFARKVVNSRLMSILNSME